MEKAKKAVPLKFWSNLSLQGFMGFMKRDVEQIGAVIGLAGHAVVRQVQHMMN